jgi:hypothetical protein
MPQGLAAIPQLSLRIYLQTRRLTYGAPARPITGWPTSLRPLIAHLQWCWNVDQLSIAYAFQPLLRTRLTRRGMTWRRKP